MCRITAVHCKAEFVPLRNKGQNLGLVHQSDNGAAQEATTSPVYFDRQVNVQITNFTKKRAKILPSFIFE